MRAREAGLAPNLTLGSSLGILLPLQQLCGGAIISPVLQMRRLRLGRLKMQSSRISPDIITLLSESMLILPACNFSPMEAAPATWQGPLRHW